jgi:hypothetical protein
LLRRSGGEWGFREAGEERWFTYLGFVEEFDGDADCGGEFAHGGLGLRDG